MRKSVLFSAVGADTKLVHRSGFFDERFYRIQNPDIDFSRINPLQHYLRFGENEGRNPSSRFDTAWYVAEYGHYIDGSVSPLVHYLRYNHFGTVTTRPLNDVQRAEAIRRALDAGNIRLRKMLARMPDVRHRLEQRLSGELPIPSLELMSRVGSVSAENYLHVGAVAKTCLSRYVGAMMASPGARVLDFGCGAGRVIRHFETEARNAQYWGCDIDGTSVTWCMANMSPPFRFFQLSNAPSLPFPSNSFDVVYAIAVFSQLFENWSTWAMEIRRILKPDGVYVMSYNGHAAYPRVFGAPSETVHDVDFVVRGPFTSWNQGGPHTFMSDAWVQRMWGSLFEVERIDPDGMDKQAVALMRKSASR